MRSIITIISLLFTTGTQKAPVVNILGKVNHIEIHFFKGKHPGIYKTSMAIDLQYLKGLINKAHNNPGIKTDTTGEIIYFSKNCQIFKVYFATKGSGSQLSSAIVMFNDGTKNVKSLMNYGSGMLIDEEYYQTSKNK